LNVVPVHEEWHAYTSRFGRHLGVRNCPHGRALLKRPETRGKHAACLWLRGGGSRKNPQAQELALQPLFLHYHHAPPVGPIVRVLHLARLTSYRSHRATQLHRINLTISQNLRLA
jgi:hypothetical protein